MEPHLTLIKLETSTIVGHLFCHWTSAPYVKQLRIKLRRSIFEKYWQGKALKKEFQELKQNTKVWFQFYFLGSKKKSVTSTLAFFVHFCRETENLDWTRTVWWQWKASLWTGPRLGRVGVDWPHFDWIRAARARESRSLVRQGGRPVHVHGLRDRKPTQEFKFSSEPTQQKKILQRFGVSSTDRNVDFFQTNRRKSTRRGIAAQTPDVPSRRVPGCRCACRVADTNLVSCAQSRRGQTPWCS